MKVDDFLKECGTTINDEDLILLVEASSVFASDDYECRSPWISAYRVSYKELKVILNILQQEETIDSKKQMIEFRKRSTQLPLQLLKINWVVCLSYYEVLQDKGFCEYNCNKCTSHLCDQVDINRYSFYDLNIKIDRIV